MKKTIVRAVSTAALFSTVFAGSAFANTYTVQKGDTLSKIASKHQTTVNEIKLLNSLTSDLIYINQTLKLSAATATIMPPSAGDYTVVSGDYLGKIAKQFGMTVQQLKTLNGLTSDLIYAGQTLKVSAQAVVVTPPPAVVAPSTATTEYTVISGDTLGKIALKYSVTVQQLKTLNGLSSDMIYVGQKLKVTATAPVVVTPPPVVQAPISSGDYTVKSGDTLSKISSQFGMTVQGIKTLNGLTSDLIYVGQMLKVSGSGPAVVTPPVSNSGNLLIDTAKSLIGVPYVWGGSTVNGFDCSGFIYYTLNQSGMKIGRYSAEGYYSRSYYVDTPQPGDLVFFENTYKKGISHVGFYIGNNEFIHADSDGVTISNLNNSYYKKHFEGFKRFY